MKSLVVRALIALLLAACYHALAFGIIGVLIGLPVYLAIVNSKIAFALLAVPFYPIALVIWRAAFPDDVEREGRGLRLSPSDHPRLFAVVDEVVAACDVKVRPQVFVTLGDDAAVTELRRGLLRRPEPALILGLSLLELQTVVQLKSVLAHEIGHYAGYDTRLGLWLDHTGMRLHRTTMNLEHEPFGINLVFCSYARLFSRIAAAVQRHQELVADTLAARLYGGDVAGAALRGSHEAAVGFSAYWASELVPVLDAGFRPPVIGGFRRFMASTDVTRAVEEHWSKELDEGHDPRSTHPALRERLAVNAKFVAVGGESSQESALALLSDPERVETAVLANMSNPDRVWSLTPITWEDVAAQVWLPAWESVVTPQLDSLRSLTIGSLPEAADPRVAAAAACLALHAQGWSVQALPGEPVKVARGTTTLLPFHADREPGAWKDECARAGVADMSLTVDTPSSQPTMSGSPVHARLPLAADRKSKAPTVVGMVLVGLLAVPIALMTAIMPLAAGAPPAGVAFGLVVGTSTLALFTWFCLVHARQVFRPAIVELDGDTLTIDYPVLFKQALRVSRAQVRSVTFDPGDDGAHKNRRFPLVAGSWGHGGDPDANLIWLWTKAGGSPVPMLSVLQKRPNAAILFDPPVAAPPIRREVAHGPLKGEALIGLLVAFADAQEAENAFGRLGVVRELTIGDEDWFYDMFTGSRASAPETAAV